MTEENQNKSKNWLIIGILLALVGAAISIYATNHHMELKANGSTDAACNISEAVSCDKVAQSEYSEIFGIPLGVWGLGYFIAMLVLAGMSFFNPKSYQDNMLAYSASVVVGVLVSIVLAGISFFSIGSLCPSCMGIYAVTALQVVALFAFRSAIPEEHNLKALGNGASNALIAVAAVVLIYNQVIPKPQPTQPGFEGKGEQSGNLNLSSKVENITINKSAYSGFGEDFRKGNDNAKVTLVEFADYECGACGNMAKNLKAIANEFKNQILVVFKNYPLDQACNSSINRKFHENACNIAVLSRCAGNYGKFWQYHDLAFANQKGITLDKAKALALQVGLNSEQINTCLSDKSILDKIKDDVKIANQLGVSATPTLYLNGRKVHNSSPAVIRLEINKALNGI